MHARTNSFFSPPGAVVSSPYLALMSQFCLKNPPPPLDSSIHRCIPGNSPASDVELRREPRKIAVGIVRLCWILTRLPAQSQSFHLAPTAEISQRFARSREEAGTPVGLRRVARLFGQLELGIHGREKKNTHDAKWTFIFMFFFYCSL